MRKIFIATISVVFFACNSEEKPDADNSNNSMSESTTPMPYTATYSSKFEMGNAKHAEAVLKLWKSWDSGDLSTSKDLFADTVTFYTRDGSMITGPVDSSVMSAQAYRNMFSSVSSKVDAYMPLRSTDKNENWVCIWGTEVTTDKQGKVDSVGLQETWRFNKDGKIDLLFQYGKALTPPAGGQ